jgi:hypothetical protein
VRDVGHGSLKKGERVLDLFVKKVRDESTASSEAAAAPCPQLINWVPVTPVVTPTGFPILMNLRSA